MKFLLLLVFVRLFSVASFAEAWIEINKAGRCRIVSESPPSRRRGLKCECEERGIPYIVASFAEAWIEILEKLADNLVSHVASFAEAWIEISGVKTLQGR